MTHELRRIYFYSPEAPANCILLLLKIIIENKIIENEAHSPYCQF